MALQERISIREIAATELSIENLLTLIKKMDFISPDKSVVLSSKSLLNSIFIFDNVVCDKQDAIRNYFVMETQMSTFISIKRMQRYRSILYMITNLLKQDDSQSNKRYHYILTVINVLSKYILDCIAQNQE